MRRADIIHHRIQRCCYPVLDWSFSVFFTLRDIGSFHRQMWCGTVSGGANFRKPWPILVTLVHPQNLQFKFVDQDHPVKVKVKVTGARKRETSSRYPFCDRHSAVSLQLNYSDDKSISVIQGMTLAACSHKRRVQTSNFRSADRPCNDRACDVRVCVSCSRVVCLRL